MTSFCLGCGTSMGAEERFCGNCGRDSSLGADVKGPDPTLAWVAPETSGKAIFSLIIGIFSLFPPFGLGAIIFGHISLSDIRKSSGKLVGRGLAIAGLVLGYLGVAAFTTLMIIGAYSARQAEKALTAAKAAARSKGVTRAVITNQPSAVSAIRALNTAEIAHLQAHPAQGYTCSLDELAKSWGIRGDLDQVKKADYSIALQGCSPSKADGKVTKYQVVAYPKAGKAKLPAFCSNQSDVIKVDWNGSPEGCLSKGADLTANDNDRLKNDSGSDDDSDD